MKTTRALVDLVLISHPPDIHMLFLLMCAVAIGLMMDWRLR